MYGATNNSHTLFPEEIIQTCINESMYKNSSKIKSNISNTFY